MMRGMVTATTNPMSNFDPLLADACYLTKTPCPYEDPNPPGGGRRDVAAPSCETRRALWSLQKNNAINHNLTIAFCRARIFGNKLVYSSHCGNFGCTMHLLATHT
jgi:hypothetical protein